MEREYRRKEKMRWNFAKFCKNNCDETDRDDAYQEFTKLSSGKLVARVLPRAASTENTDSSESWFDQGKLLVGFHYCYKLWLKTKCFGVDLGFNAEEGNKMGGGTRKEEMECSLLMVLVLCFCNESAMMFLKREKIKREMAKKNEEEGEERKAKKQNGMRGWCHWSF